MRVSKELIEKYHLGKCTPKESSMVENWLLDDDTETEIFLPADLEKESLKNAMWEEIGAVLPSEKAKILKLSKTSWAYLGAAASIAAILTFSIFALKQNKPAETIATVNVSTSENQEIDSKDYTISVGPESNAHVDSKSGLINFCGTILISPKKDIFLSFNDVCENAKSNTGKLNFKKGETYIALNYRNKKDNELIVMDEKLLMGLPPMVKRQIMDQFNI